MVAQHSVVGSRVGDSVMFQLGLQVEEGGPRVEEGGDQLIIIIIIIIIIISIPDHLIMHRHPVPAGVEPKANG